MVEGKNGYKGWLYLAPSLILVTIFILYPLVNTMFIAFQEDFKFVLGGAQNSGIGLGNFASLFSKNNSFWQYLGNTMIIVFVSVPISITLSLLIAVSLNSIKKLQKLFQTIFFMPYVTNAIAIGMVFAVMFNTDSGLINSIMRMCGLDPINWLGSASGTMVDKVSYFKCLVVLITYITWSSLPFKILILLSGLQSVDQQYYNAAKIDGASKKTILWRITIPLLSPQIAYLFITSFIGAFKEYTAIVAIFGVTAGPIGDQNNSMATVVWYIYNQVEVGASSGGYGRAAAAALILFVIIMIFTAINGLVSKKRVHF